MLQSIKQQVKYRETTVIIFSTRFVFKSQNNTMKTAGASILMSSGWCFILFDFGWKQHKKGIKKIHETSTCLQFNSSLKSVHIQDHLNHIYHHGATRSSLFTQQLKHLLFLKKRAKIATLRATRGRHRGPGGMLIREWFFCHSPVCHPWLLLFLYPTARTSTSTSTAAAAMLADSMLIKLGSCNRNRRLGLC